jgi:thymidylate kinase
MSAPVSAEARRAVLALLEERNGFRLSTGEERNLISFLRANKYPALAFGDGETLGEPWRSELARASALYTEQREEYLLVRKAWLERGIESIAFKSGGTTPSFPYTSDNLDILIRREHQRAAIEALEDLGYVWLTNTDEREKLLFRRFRGGRCASAIHLHTWIGWDAAFHEEEEVWKRVRTAPDDPELLVPSPEDAILINVAHALYENKQFSLYDLEKVREHWGSEDLDWAYMEGIARRRGWLDGLYFGLAVAALAERQFAGKTTAPSRVRRRWRDELRKRPGLWWYYRRLVAREDVGLPFHVSFTLSKLLYYKKIAGDQHDTAGARLANLAHTLAWGVKQKSGLNPQPGMLVTFSGVDGSGKSRHAAALSDALTVCDVTHVNVWSRPGCSRLYRAISRTKDGDAPATGEPGPIRPAPGGKLARLAWAGFNVLDLALVYNWSVRRRLLTGNFVVCDRFAADAQVELASRLPEGDRAARWLVSFLPRLAPRPRVAFLLDLPPDEAAARSADPEDAETLGEQRRIYLGLSANNGTTVTDATREFAVLNDDLVREALRTYFGRFGTLPNGLLLSNPEQLNPALFHGGGR